MVKRLSDWLSGPQAKRMGLVVGVIWTIAMCAALVGMFFTERFPSLKPFVWWTLIITFCLPCDAFLIRRAIRTRTRSATK
jgi:hypothetical protein